MHMVAADCVVFGCPGCGQQIALEDPRPGVVWSCPTCGRAVAVPQTGAVAGSQRSTELPALASVAASASRRPPAQRRAGEPCAWAVLVIVLVGLAGGGLIVWGGLGVITADNSVAEQFGLVRALGGLAFVAAASVIALLRRIVLQLAGWGA